MNELDLKEVLWMLHMRILDLEVTAEIPYSDFIKRSDIYIKEALDRIKEGE